MAETVGTGVVRLIVDGSDVDDGIRKSLDDSDATFADKGEEHGEIYTKERNKAVKEGDADLVKDTEKTTRSMKQRWADFRKDLGRVKGEFKGTRSESKQFGDTIGRMFGKGGRNDFINIIGSLAGQIAHLGSTASKAGRFIEPLVNLLGSGSKGAPKGGGGGLGAGGSLVGGAFAAGAAIYVIVQAIGVLGAAVSGITGIITALASVLAFGLFGALGAAAGAALALAGAFGVVALAIANLSDAQKKALKPIGDEFGRLGDAAAKGFGPALVRNVDGIVKAMKPLEKIVEDVGVALGHVLDGFVDSLNGPAWKRFERVFGRALPGLVEGLGNSFTNLGEAFAGVFSAMTPLVQRFVSWLEKVTGQFADWANSAKGQERLRQFFEDAGDAAASLGRFIGAAAEAIFKLFDAGNKPGQTLIDDLTKKFKEFADWLSSPEGKKSLSDWFDNAIELGEHLGDLFMQIIDFIDKTDTKESRENLLAVIDAVTKLIGLFTTLYEWLQKTIKLGRKLADIFKHAVTMDWRGLFKDLAPSARKAFGALKGKLGDWMGKVNWSDVIKTPWPRVNSLVSGMAKRISNAMGDVNWSAVFKDPWGTVSRFLHGMGRRIGNAIGKVDWGSIFGDPWDTLKGKISGIGKQISDLIGDITVDIFPDIHWPSVPSSIAKVFHIGGSASGGVFGAPMVRLIGEDGPEAVVPLNRSLSRVDPSVRALSAVAQGKALPGQAVAQSTINNTFNITTPTKDPRAVASEVINRLAAVGY